MNDRQHSMKFNRKPPIGSRVKKSPTSDASTFGNETDLVEEAANVLKDGRRMDHVERSISKGHLKTIGPKENHAWIELLQKRSVIDTSCNNFRLKWIPRFDIVRARVALVGSHADIKQCVLFLD